MAGDKTVEEEERKGMVNIEGIEVAQTHARDIKMLDSGYDLVNEDLSAHKYLPSMDVWSDKPLLLRESSLHNVRENAEGHLPIENQVHPFETDLFEGKILVRLRSHPDAASYFEGKKRLSSILISGKFKKAVGFGDVFTGQEFSYPVRKPSDFIVSGIVKFFNLLAPLLHIRCSDETFYSLSPLAQTVQAMYVSEEPLELTPELAVDDNFGEVELDRRMTREERKKYFSKKENLGQFTFATDKFYTFDFYNDKVDLESFSLKVMGMEFELHEYIHSQPLRVLARIAQEGDPNGQYLWNFEIWHKKVADQLEQAQAQTETTSPEDASSG